MSRKTTKKKESWRKWVKVRSTVFNILGNNFRGAEICSIESRISYYIYIYIYIYIYPALLAVLRYEIQFNSQFLF